MTERIWRAAATMPLLLLVSTLPAGTWFICVSSVLKACLVTLQISGILPPLRSLGYLGCYYFLFGFVDFVSNPIFDYSHVPRRQEGVPRTFKEICSVSKTSKKEIGRCFKLILKALETYVDIITTSDFMNRFCRNLGKLIATWFHASW